MSSHNRQLTQEGRLRHLINIDGLSTHHLMHILNQAEQFFDPDTGKLQASQALNGLTVTNLFYEPSTRTRATFQLAAKNLGATVLNLNIPQSSTTKGESFLDTMMTIQAMQCNMLIIRHPYSGAVQFVADHAGPDVSVINAGDGCHAHPTQALLDMYTIRKHRGDFQNLSVAIVGDIRHSRVARSQIEALHMLKTGEIRAIGPKTLLPYHLNNYGVNIFHSLEQGLKNVDVIILLRLQKERMSTGLLPSGNAYFNHWGLTLDKMRNLNPDALVIHPGPTNREVEIESAIADSKNAAILDQVTNGIAVRMAIMAALAENHPRKPA